MFKIGSTTKVECLSLAWAWYKCTNNVQAWAYYKVYKLKLGLAWLGLIHWSSQARAQYQAQTQAQYHVFEFEIQHKYIIKPISSLLSSLFGLDYWSQLIIN